MTPFSRAQNAHYRAKIGSDGVQNGHFGQSFFELQNPDTNAEIHKRAPVFDGPL